MINIHYTQSIHMMIMGGQTIKMLHNVRQCDALPQNAERPVEKIICCIFT